MDERVLEDGEESSMDQLEEGIRGHVPELGGVEFEASRLPLPLPYLIIGTEDAVSEEIPDSVPEIATFGEIKELCLQKVLEIPWIRGDDAVEIGEPGPSEDECPVLTGKNVGYPFVYVSMETGE